MTTEEFKLAFQILQFAITLALAFYVHLTNKDKATNTRIAKLEEDITDEVNGHSSRIARIEVHIEKVPTHADMANIHEKINQVSSCVKRLEGDFSGAKHTLDLIHEFLMKGGK